MSTIEPYQYQFVETHKRYLEAWGIALRTGEPRVVEAFIAENECAATAELGSIISSYKGATHRTENRVIRPRNEREVVVFYERMMEREGQIVKQFQVLQTWSQMDDEWRVIRELVESL